MVCAMRLTPQHMAGPATFTLRQGGDCPPAVPRRHTGNISYQPFRQPTSKALTTREVSLPVMESGRRTCSGHVGAEAGFPSGLLVTFSIKSMVEWSFRKSGSTGPARDHSSSVRSLG